MRKNFFEWTFLSKKVFENKQLLRTMKTTLFLLLFVTFQAYCGNSYSQNAKVSIPDSQLRVGKYFPKLNPRQTICLYTTKRVSMYGALLM